MTKTRNTTARYTGICHTSTQPVVEAYGNNKEKVTQKTLAGALCFNESSFSILTTQPGKPSKLEHFTITNSTTGSYTLTN